MTLHLGKSQQQAGSRTLRAALFHTGALACLDLGLLLLATQLTLLLADTLNLAPQTTTLSSFSLLLDTLLDGMKLAALDR